MTEKSILFDSTKCIACRACQVACKQWNGLRGEETNNRGSYENPPDLSPQTWIKMRFIETGKQGVPGWTFLRQACMHCTDAACVRVCPNGSLYHHPLGFVAYNKDTCTGCGYCIDACPFHVPRSTRNILTGIAKMDKCTLCTTQGLDRIAEGWEPACVKTCPPYALKFGDRDPLKAEGTKRVQALKSQGYANAYLYGERELNGLHVLYVLDNSPGVYGLPVDPQVPATVTAWKGIIQPLGWVLGGLTIVGLGLNYMVARQAKIARDLQAEKEK